MTPSDGQARKIRGRQASGRKLAEQIAEEVEREIMANGWPVGQQLGTEVSLAERYGVSRAVMREAVRILEHHMVASPRRGTGGGIMIRSPDIGAVVPVVRLFLDHEGVSRASLLEARSTIELSAVALAKRSVHLTTGFFGPPPELIEALEAAARRGVDVVLVTPSNSDSQASV